MRPGLYGGEAEKMEGTQSGLPWLRKTEERLAFLSAPFFRIFISLQSFRSLCAGSPFSGGSDPCSRLLSGRNLFSIHYGIVQCFSKVILLQKALFPGIMRAENDGSETHRQSGMWSIQ